MQTRSLLLLSFLAAVPAGAAEVSLVPIAGYQVLTHTSLGISHGPLDQEVFFGRSFVGGLGLDIGLTERQHLRFEVQAGPYHDDFEQFCIERILPSGIVCDAGVGLQTRHALLAGADYTFVPLGDRVGFVIGLGAGIKKHSFDQGFRVDVDTTALTISGIAGLEFPGKAPVRLEGRFMYLPDHPLLDGAGDPSETELLVSLSVRIPLSKR